MIHSAANEPLQSQYFSHTHQWGQIQAHTGKVSLERCLGLIQGLFFTFSTWRQHKHTPAVHWSEANVQAAFELPCEFAATAERLRQKQLLFRSPLP